MDLFIKSGAIFSPCERYRYSLWRLWDETLPTLNVIGLNPSTATALIDDNTIRRCRAFAHRWGFGGLQMTNVYGWRSTDPRGLLTPHDPIGPENDFYLLSRAQHAGRVLVAWGAYPQAVTRSAEVLKLLEGIHLVCLGRTKHGAPRHPLFIAQQTPYEDYP